MLGCGNTPKWLAFKDLFFSERRNRFRHPFGNDTVSLRFHSGKFFPVAVLADCLRFPRKPGDKEKV